MTNFIPHNYQGYCILQALQQEAIALWLDMGLGKTVITLTVLNELKYNRFAINKTLIVAPKKVAEATWQKEIAKWSHLSNLRVSTVLGTATQRIKAIHMPADIYITSRDNVQWLVEYLKNDWCFDTVVLDEASSFKNPQAKRFKKLKAIKPHFCRVIELTGTPSPRSYLDLWAQIYLLDGGARLGKTFTQYRERFFTPDKRNKSTVFSYRLRDGAQDEITTLLSDICISMKAADYINLPSAIEHDIPVVLSASASIAYKKMERDMLLQVDLQTIDAATAAVLRAKLLQIASGACYDAERRVVPVHDCKLEAFKETVEQLCGQSALVFYSFVHDKDRIVQALKGTGLRVKLFDTPKDADDWNEGKIDILLAHPASCAYGINLQFGGHHIIWFGITDSLELYLQANARLHRQGQTEPVIVHRLIVQGTVDEDVVNGIIHKDEMQETLLQSMKARIEKVKSEAV